MNEIEGENPVGNRPTQGADDNSINFHEVVATFEAEWQEAVKRGGDRWLIYPEANPKRQWDLFERVKIEQIQKLLLERNIRQGRVLEYGCGSAGVSIFLANQGFQSIAFDISRNALEIAGINRNRHKSESTEGHFDLCRGDTFNLPFKDESFDIVMSFGLLEHFDRDTIYSSLHEVLRTLKPNGLFLADITHGRFSIRKAGLALSFVGSFLSSLLRLRLNAIPRLYAEFFHEHYENDLDYDDYVGILKAYELSSVQMQVCRPFPPLLLPSATDTLCIKIIDTLYTKVMKMFLPFWKWFDRTDNWLINRIGWMYLVSARK